MTKNKKGEAYMSRKKRLYFRNSSPVSPDSTIVKRFSNKIEANIYKLQNNMCISIWGLTSPVIDAVGDVDWDVERRVMDCVNLVVPSNVSVVN
jgi:hypothetical protein